MNFNNIKKLEKEIKKLHLNPKQNGCSIDKETKEAFSLFWYLHLSPVINYSKKLAKKYKAKMNVVWLSAIFHDIARLDDLEPHDEIGADRAYKILLKEGANEELAKEVRATILTHRCKKHKPKTLEQKILATADAISHFKSPFYLWFSSTSKKPFKEQLRGNLKKLERDFKKKIFFEDERKLVEKEYSVLKNWFKYYLKIK